MLDTTLEWCYDWYGPYRDTVQTNPIGVEDGIAKVVRGGLPDIFIKEYSHPEGIYTVVDTDFECNCKDSYGMTSSIEYRASRNDHSSSSVNSPALRVKIMIATIPRIIWTARVYQTYSGLPASRK